VAGTTYEAMYHADFSIILLLLAIKFCRLIATVPKPSLQSFLNVTNRMSHPQLWKYWVKTHMFIFQLSCYQKAGRRAKHYKAVAVSIAPN